ncbi:alpha/beta fold hydrolase [Streptomyces sp. NPDC048257]|uniref:alpha/beta fold hydrolase n=1 Tax=Streptomyces sp. NPDC048257 TaxID=3365526 RepID=UPI003719C804
MAGTPTFTTFDGTELAYHLQGAGEPLICIPGGAMRASAYLGDLGGPADRRLLILLDLRGTGDSAVPADESTYRVDHQAGDVDALRVHLGAGARGPPRPLRRRQPRPALRGRAPERLRRTVRVTPTAWAVDLPVTAEDRLEGARLRAGGEPYDTAIAAYERILTDTAHGEEDWERAAPVFYGNWDETARAHWAANAWQQNEKAAEAYAGPGAFDPPATREALRRVTGEVLVLAAELDGNPRPALAARLATLFPRGSVDVQPRAGHFPWLDDAAWFAARVERFLAAGA